MAQIVAPLLSNFNAGVLSPLMDGRVDVAKYGNGCYRMENFIPTVQGPVKRRMGVRFVQELEDSSEVGWLRRFVFSQTQAYILEFTPGRLRFYTNNGILLNLGVPYEIVTPYTASDLTNADGTFGLDFAQTGDVLFIAAGAHPLQQLTRLGATNWTIADAAISGGPFTDVNPDNPITVWASAATGAGITLTSVAGAAFTAPMVDQLFLIEQRVVDDYKAWEVNKVVALSDERRSDGNVYSALNAGTTGTIKPTHREGAKFDGDAGVQWQYLHSGYGIVRIVSIGGGGTTAVADVISRLPSEVVGAPNATPRWASSEWRSDLGYPTLVTFFRERLTLFRKARGWFSVAADFLNFSNRDGAETLPDSAISIDITTSELNDSTFLVPAKRLLVGTTAAEFSIGELATSEVFGPGNVAASLQTSHGSRQVPPAIVNDSTLFHQAAGRRCRDLRYAFDADGYQTTDLSVLSNDILRGQVVQHAFQEEPDNVLWNVTRTGELIGFTFNREQDVIGWHNHPLAEDCWAESVDVIPSPDGTHDQPWFIFRLLVNGVTRRYVGYMDPDWRPYSAALSDCLYSDMGGTFNGMDQTGTITVDAAFAGPDTTGTLTASIANFTAGDVGDLVVIEAHESHWCRFEITAFTDSTHVTARQMDALPSGFAPGDASSDWAFARDQIAGLDYLEGRTVAVLGDGASHPEAVVTAGVAQLQRHVMVAQVGLPMVAELETMRLEAGAQNGTAQGKIKRVHQVILRFFETLGGYVGSTNEAGQKVLDQILFRSSSAPMNQPPMVFTGDKLCDFPSGYTTAARIIVQQPQPLPMTLVAIMPQLVTHDNGGPG